MHEETRELWKGKSDPRNLLSSPFLPRQTQFRLQIFSPEDKFRPPTSSPKTMSFTEYVAIYETLLPPTNFSYPSNVTTVIRSCCNARTRIALVAQNRSLTTNIHKERRTPPGHIKLRRLDRPLKYAIGALLASQE